MQTLPTATLPADQKPIAAAHARGGMVASPHYLASRAGAAILQAGGSAVDAAIAANAVLTVVYPHMCSIGGDGFMLIHDGDSDKLWGLNGSGRAAQEASIARLHKLGQREMPLRGPLPVTVPGAVSGWLLAHLRFGKLPWATVLAAAIAVARDGFLVTPRLHSALGSARHTIGNDPQGKAIFYPGNRLLAAGETLRNPQLARSLTQIAADPESFYRGKLAQSIAADVQQRGGLLTTTDFVTHHADWVEPISVVYRGYRVYELPPNTQGLAVVLGLGILDGFDLGSMGAGSAAATHHLVEAKKIAFADRGRIADPTFVPLPPALLTADYAAERRKLLDPHHAAGPIPQGQPAGGDTIYLCAADRWGNVVSLIQSIYFAFGAGFVAGDTGIVLHNRGAYFQLDASSPNSLQPGKRPFHTLIPAMAYRQGEDHPALAFGTRGADGQPQTQMQVFSNIADFGMDVAAAIAAPRWVHGGTVPGERADLLMESRFPTSVRRQLQALGHTVNVASAWSEEMGHAQAISRTADGYAGFADPRGDGEAVGVD